MIIILLFGATESIRLVLLSVAYIRRNAVRILGHPWTSIANSPEVASNEISARCSRDFIVDPLARTRDDLRTRQLALFD